MRFVLVVIYLLTRCWCVVWQLFLSKFKFLRELIGDAGSQQEDSENAKPEAEPDALLLTPQRSRQKPARQRKGLAEERLHQPT
uniref:Small integral membrane protein 13 n=1 Tax=Laticauda laticaudata TaxID=8630 RepID=A0A8C5WU03_LATLA